MDIVVVYEDNDLVVVDKPSGVVVNRAETVKEETIQDWWDKRYKANFMGGSIDSNIQDEEYFLERSGLVHRLDRETSGVMIMAKSVRSFIELLRQFKEREVQKEYLALTHGVWKLVDGEIAASVGRMRHNRKMMGVREDGRDSVTQYHVLSTYLGWSFPKELKVDDRGYSGFSLVKFLPKTGRTHQIRVHARHVGHPLVGDPVYAGRKRAREDRKWAKRVMLQANKIEFVHPVTGERMSFVSTNNEIGAIVNYLLPNKQ